MVLLLTLLALMMMRDYYNNVFMLLYCIIGTVIFDLTIKYENDPTKYLCNKLVEYVKYESRYMYIIYINVYVYESH